MSHTELKLYLILLQSPFPKLDEKGKYRSIKYTVIYVRDTHEGSEQAATKQRIFSLDLLYLRLFKHFRLNFSWPEKAVHVGLQYMIIHT